MLSISVISGSGSEAARYYTEEFSKEDYYVNGQEPPGQWRGAESLGLTGDVRCEQLANLFDGLTPDGRSPLVKMGGQEHKHRSGWDCTFSAPKSVSLLYARAEGDLRDRIKEAHERAVEASLSHMERVTLSESVRRYRSAGGKAEIFREAPKNIIAAKFQHRTSREMDPQLHTHCLVMNVAERKDGTWGALDLNQAYKEKKSLGAIYRAELSHILQKEMGFAVERDREFFRLKEVPKALEEEFSKRRKQILEAMKSRGWESAQAAEQANLLTRGKKKNVDNETLISVWQTQFDKLGWSHEKFLEHFGKGQAQTTERDLDALRKETADRALKDLTATASTFTLEGLKSKFCESAQTNMSALEVEHEFQKYRSFEGLVSLSLDEKGRERFTTKEILQIEEKMMETAKTLAENSRHGISEGKQFWQIIQFERRKSSSEQKVILTADQKEAVSHAMSEGQIKIIHGIAGAGKSFSMELVKTAYESEGYRVRGLAPTGKAARTLEESGIKSVTLDKFFLDRSKDRDGFAYRDVVVVDEAAMVGSRKTERLLSDVRESGAKLIMIGDPDQYKPIDAGGAFRALSKEVGHTTLTTIYRQKEEWQKEAVMHFRAGEAKEALSMYHDRKLLEITKDSGETRKSIVRDYTSHRESKPLESSLVLARTNKEVELLNKDIRAELRSLGLIKKETEAPAIVHTTKKKQERHFAEGDRVVFLKNNSGIGVQNGLMGEVLAVEKDARGHARFLDIKTDIKDQVRVDLFSYDRLDHAYAVTGYKSQGSTLDRVFVQGSPQMDKSAAYVMMSRQKIEAKLYVSLDDFGVKNLEPLISPRQTSLFAEMERRLEAEKMAQMIEKVASPMSREDKKEVSLDYLPAHEKAETKAPEKKREPESIKEEAMKQEPVIRTTPRLVKLSESLGKTYSPSQVTTLRDIAQCCSGISSLKETPVEQAPWQTLARDILRDGSTDRVPELKKMISDYPAGGSVHKKTEKQEAWSREVNTLYDSRYKLAADYQSEYVTPRLQKIAAYISVHGRFMSKQERVEQLTEIASLPRGVGSERQKHWNPALASFQITARDMLREGKLNVKGILSLGASIEKLPVGREPSFEPDRMEKIEGFLQQRRAGIEKEAEKSIEKFRSQERSMSMGMSL